jgi:hypothetical protein
MRGAIFRDVSTALTTSFGMNARPALEANSTRQALTVIALARPAQNRMQSDYVKRLIGTPSRNVDFSGLTKLEVRAECALVRKTAVERLEAPHASAVLARFGKTHSEREAGIDGLATHLCGIGKCERASPLGEPARVEAVRMLIVRRYRPQAFRKGFSFRSIAERTRVPKSTLARIANLIEHEADVLEAEALAQLELILVPRGVCDSGIAQLQANSFVLRVT